jgi:DNA mismatch repair protein MutS
VKKQQKDLIFDLIHNKLPTVITTRDDWIFEFDYGSEHIKNHFQAHSLKGFGLDTMTEGVVTAGAILNYLKEGNKASLDHIQTLRVLNLSEYMILDDATRRNLEIQAPLREYIGGNTLLSVLDHTHTAMGGRILRKWLNQPLRVVESIQKRLDIVEELYHDSATLKRIKTLLAEVSDIERLMGKISSNRANARDLVNLKNSLEIIPQIKSTIIQSNLPNLIDNFAQLDDVPEIVNLVSKSIIDDPALTITDGGIIKDGFNSELDELKDITHQGKKWIVALQDQERKRTGINTLKINYNKVFGYYIEITKANLAKKPEDYIRKQTLVNAERFITPALKEKEEKILGAEEKLKSLEYELFQQVREQIALKTKEIQENSYKISFLDGLCSFAQVSYDNKYIRPEINEERVLRIKNGRHPVVEKFMKPGEEFVPNDVFLDPQKEQIWIITGPNMAGKSTFLRQVGLIVFMAQIGCFVPAEEAAIGIVDRIFTRVGASDNLASGESTFLVEMNETANILNNATDRSLVLLDEIGRGTSTFDGLAIAWAVSEFLHNEKLIRAKTLFATHYHELTELALIFPRIKNYNIAVEEWEKQIIFLRKILPGGTDNSYGIHVAEMAGLPKILIERAREILANLEANELSPNRMPRLAKRRPGREVDHSQLSLFEKLLHSKVEKRLKDLDIDNMTPINALVKLNELRKMLDK